MNHAAALRILRLSHDDGVLGVIIDGSEVKRAFRREMLAHHPDKVGSNSEETCRRAQAIVEARDYLLAYPDPLQHQYDDDDDDDMSASEQGQYRRQAEARRERELNTAKESAARAHQDELDAIKARDKVKGAEAHIRYVEAYVQLWTLLNNSSMKKAAEDELDEARAALVQCKHEAVEAAGRKAEEERKEAEDTRRRAERDREIDKARAAAQSAFQAMMSAKSADDAGKEARIRYHEAQVWLWTLYDDSGRKKAAEDELAEARAAAVKRNRREKDDDDDELNQRQQQQPAPVPAEAVPALVVDAIPEPPPPPRANAAPAAEDWAQRKRREQDARAEAWLQRPPVKRPCRRIARKSKK